jgi:uncharacterized membrane protein
MTSRSVATLGILTALVAALGYALAGVPNVELVSLASFVAGFVLGAAGGAFAGGAGMALYSALNPYGIAMPPVFVAQVIGMSLFGLAGARSGPWLAGSSPPLAVTAGVAIGAGLTLVYDVLTNLGTVAVMGAWSDPWPVLAGGIAFGLGHLVSNAVLFGVLLPPLLVTLRRRLAARLP